MNTAGARKSAPVAYRASVSGPAEGGGAAWTGGSAVIPLRCSLGYLPFLYAAAAADSSCVWMPDTSFGLSRNFWNSPQRPWPVVAPNDGGCSSDMSNTTDFAVSSGASVERVIASG